MAGTHTKYYGGEVYRLPLLAENDFLPDLDSIPADIRRRAKLLVLNYPEQPDRQGGHAGVLRASDRVRPGEPDRGGAGRGPRHAHLRRAAAELPASAGGTEVGVEVHSLSKGWNMIGWRMGWVCGNERIVRALADVKDNCDSGQFIAIQKAAAAALDDPEIPRRTRAKYRRRLEKLVATLGRCGFDCRMPGGTYFLYTPSPKGAAGGLDFPTAEAASQYLITEHSICTVPWDDAGPHLRFSVTYEAADEAAEDALMAETERRLKQIQPVF